MADLLRRVAEQADPAAFRELYQTYGPRVKAYMMRQGADAATAEDLAQETLFTVWRRASLYAADKGSAATWIFAIARNLRIDRLRREVPWQELPEERLEQPSSEAAARRGAGREGASGARAGGARPAAARAARGRGALLSRRLVARRDRRAPEAAAGHGEIAHAHRLPEDPRRRSRTCDDHHASPRRRDADELRRRRPARLRCPRWQRPMSTCAPAAGARSRRSSASAAPCSPICRPRRWTVRSRRRRRAARPLPDARCSARRGATQPAIAEIAEAVPAPWLACRRRPRCHPLATAWARACGIAVCR